MSKRPAYNIISHFNKVKLTKDETREAITDFAQIRESLTLGINSLGELMAIAASEDNNMGVSQEALVDASFLISTLCDFIQGCNDQEIDCLNYVNGEPSYRELYPIVQSKEGAHENAQHL